MDKGMWIIFTAGGMMILTLWAFSGLQQHHSHESQMRVVRSEMDEYDQDIVVIDSLSANRNAAAAAAPQLAVIQPATPAHRAPQPPRETPDNRRVAATPDCTEIDTAPVILAER